MKTIPTVATMGELLIKAMLLLRNEREQLLQWAKESEAGGWSTHQVKPMRKRAQYLKNQLDSLSDGVKHLFD